MGWTLTFSLHWPHDRFALGWEYIRPTEDEPLDSYILFLLILTISLDLPAKE
jgi:hypothetical protein